MKFRIFGAALICAALLVAGGACKDGDKASGGPIPTTQPGQQMTAEEIMDAAATITETGFNTYRFTMDMSMVMTMLGETITMTMDASGSVDEPNEKMYMEMLLDMGELGTGTSEVYVLNDWMYMSMQMMGMDMGWIKTPLTEELWDSQDMSGQQLELLDTFVDVQLLGTETVSGVECYKLRVVPDLDDLWDWAQMQEGMEDSGMELDPEEVIDDFSIVVWVSKGTYHIVKTDIDMTMSLMGSTTTMSMTMTLFNIDQPVYISLPAEAADAIEFDLEL